MNKFKIEQVEDCHHVFFRVWNEDMICFQGDSVEECEDYILRKRAVKAKEMREYKNYEFAKTTVNFAESRDMGIGYDNRDYMAKEEQDYHSISVYLELESDGDCAISFKVTDFVKGEFVAEFSDSWYGQEADAIIKQIVPSVIHGEKELRQVVKLLANRREELLSLSN